MSLSAPFSHFVSATQLSTYASEQLTSDTCESGNSSPHLSTESPIASLLSHDNRQTTESAFLQTLAVLDNLRSKPSCHRDSIGHLLSSCFELQKASNSQHVDSKKAALAARIAICEFESAGIDYPRDCRALKGGRADHGDDGCLRRLADRPQWWTTLSNSMQTVNVICKSVAREAQRGTLPFVL